MRLLIKSRTVTAGYFAVVGALLAAYLASWAVAEMGYPGQLGFRDKFDLDAEATVPSMFAALSLLVCGGLLAIVAAHLRQRGEAAWRWALLAAIFAFLALDEAIAIHELFVSHTQRLIHTSGPFRFAWVIPYGIGAFAGLVMYWPWLRALPAPIRRRFILAAVLYLGGALGMEMVGGQLMDSGYRQTHWYTVTTTIEEMLEFAGVGVFLGGLITYLEQLRAELTIGFSDPAASR